MMENTPPLSSASPYFSVEGRVWLYHDDFLALPFREESIDLVVTSPPYNVGIDYEACEDSVTYDEYLHFTADWLKKLYAILKPDGRLCLNIPLDKNKGGQRCVYADFMQIAKAIGFGYHSTIIWNEGNISRRTAWGSWKSARAPYVIAPVEMIAVLYKHSWRKQQDGISDISREEFMEWTMGVWSFSGESKKRIGHPAPFPIELPVRCIKLFSYVGDTVLDPFAGSGTTLVAALKLGRKGIGVELSLEYCNIARQRLIQAASDIWLQNPTPKSP